MLGPLRVLSTLFCLVLFLLMIASQVKVYREEPTGTSLERRPAPRLPFPALTVCDPNYENRRAVEELGFPRSPFGLPREISAAPGYFLEKLALLDKDVVPNIWEYYFTLDQVLNPRRKAIHMDDRCRVGHVSCGPELPRRGDQVLPKNLSHQEHSVEVKAGVWTSRIMSDSLAGKIYLCHTLTPNVTANFTTGYSSSMSIAWRQPYSTLSSYRHVYVHDRHEDVLLKSFAIGSADPVVIRKKESKLSTVHKKKLKVVPTMLEQREQSDLHPCNEMKGYSQNRCNIRFGWHKKVEELRNFYGANFSCLLPGVWGDERDRAMEVCQHLEARPGNNFTLGLRDLDTLKDIGAKVPLLGLAPPLGTYTQDSPCVKRCSVHSFDLLEETVSPYDDATDIADLYLYFPSPIVVTWSEYRLIKSLDFATDLGGALGLVMGTSLLTMLYFLQNFVQRALQQLRKLC